MSTWEKLKLGDICDKITDGSHFSPKEFIGGTKMIATVKDMSLFGFDLEQCKRISEKDYDNLVKSGCKPLKDDVLFSKDGTIGIVHLFKGDYDVVILSSIALIRPNKIIVHPTFLSLLLRSSKVQNEVYENYRSGSALPRVILKDFKKIELSIPDIPTQTRIASILSALDDKIELNRQMNQTLEQMAQALFKKYFVDDIDKDNLPEGWRLFELGEIAEIIDCLHSKKPEKLEYDSGKILLQLENILDNGLVDTNNKFFISENEYKKWVSRIQVKFGDCIITNVGRSGVAARIPNGIQIALGRNMTAIRLKNKFPYPGLLITLLTSDYFKKEIERKLDIGTILNALNVRNIPKLQFYFTKNHSSLIKMEKITEPIRLKMEQNLKESSYLIKLRDALLPKLMNGELLADSSALSK